MRSAALIAAIAALLCAARTGCAALPQSRLAWLEANVQLAEDFAAIEKLQRAYGYYVDKGLWEDVAALFTGDAVANYPAGVFVGRDSIRQHLYLNVGGRRMGDIGLDDGRLYDHMNIQPVVHVDAGGITAHGRWRALALLGNFGGSATWAEGVYEMRYRKEGGRWKISRLDYYSGFSAPYKTGWVTPAQTPSAAGATSSSASPQATASSPAAGATQADANTPVSRRKLTHPADQPRDLSCEGFPKACVAPFHYGNPGTTEAANAWTIPDVSTLDVESHSLQSLTPARLRQRAADLEHRVTLLQDAQTLENLQRIYGYYLDRAQWDQAADLFADDATFESGQQGVYAGRHRVRQYLGTLGRQGLSYGWMFDHIQLQPIVDVAPDGRTARSRSRELDMTGHLGEPGRWTEGVYENTFIKQNGVWKFKSLHFYPTFITAYDKGWGQDAQPAPGIDRALPPDRPPTEVYATYPTAHIPPFHYPNPVTGDAAHHPTTGGLRPRGSRSRRVRLPRRCPHPCPHPGRQRPAPMPHPQGTTNSSRPAASLERSLAAAERGLQRVQDWYEIENLESAYGYYLDKNLWNDLADLFSADGSMELAQRGVYQGREHVRAFLLKVFGRGQEGPVEGRLGNHLQLQPVIDVAPDGWHAKIRIRMLQQMSLGGRASLGAAVYENTAVKENGHWKLQVDHTYNTLSASYAGGWTRGASRNVPGEDKALPPDAPPTTHFEMFPVVYDIPFHYANPVTGRTAVPEILDGSGARAMPPDIATALRAIGPVIDPQSTTKLYVPLLLQVPYIAAVVNPKGKPGDDPARVATITRDVSYGPDERNKADVYVPLSHQIRPQTQHPAQGRPILVFVPGGGFTGGSKHTDGSPFYDNIGLWAADHGLVGVVINYRLAPQAQWPAGIEDLTRLVAFLKAHAHDYGGDPQRIYLWGHSAGGAHVADYVAHVAEAGEKPQIAGAILMSGAVYDLGAVPSAWKSYYGEDVSQYAARSSLPGLVKTTTPLLALDAELDPPSFAPQTDALIKAREAAGRPVPHVHLAGHSHLSEGFSIGTSDETVSGPVLAFIRGEPISP